MPPSKTPSISLTISWDFAKMHFAVEDEKKSLLASGFFFSEDFAIPLLAPETTKGIETPRLSCLKFIEFINLDKMFKPNVCESQS